MKSPNFFKWFKFALLFLLNISILGAENNANKLELITESTGLLIAVDFNDFDKLLEAMKNGEPELKLEEVKSHRKYAYFKTSVKIKKYFRSDENDKFVNMEILIPAIKLGKDWRFIDPQLKSGSAIIIVENMYVGFDSFLCLKMYNSFSNQLSDELRNSIDNNNRSQKNSK